jgi:hypothetical protein
MTTSQATESTKSYILKHSSTIKSFFYHQGKKKKDFSEKVVNFVETTMHYIQNGIHLNSHHLER